PWDQALVKATVPIFGEAFGKDFASYQVSVASGWAPSTFTALNEGYTPQAQWSVPPGAQATLLGNLATWETGLVPGEEYPATDLFHPPKDLGYRGRWTIQLSAKDAQGAVKTDVKHVIIGRVINNGTGGLIVSDDGKASIRVPPISLTNDWDIF